MMGAWENEPRKTTIRAEEAHASSYGRPPSSWLSPQRCAASWGGPRAQPKHVGLCCPLWRNRRVRWRFGGPCFRERRPSCACSRGRPIDGRGRRIVMLFGFAVLIVGTVGPLFTHDVAPFVVFRILQGAGFSAVTTASATAAADALPASRMGEGIRRPRTWPGAFHVGWTRPSLSPSCRPTDLRTSLSA